MSGPQSWMLYGAAGHTGALIAQHARERRRGRADVRARFSGICPGSRRGRPGARAVCCRGLEG
jgi:hypothetical protein